MEDLSAVINCWKIFIALFTILCAISTRKIYNYFQNVWSIWQSNRKIVSTKGHWYWGHLSKFTPNEEGVKNRWNLMKVFPKVHLMKHGPFFHGVCCYHPSVVGPILNDAKIPKSQRGKNSFSPWIGDGLLVSSGKKWKRNRKLLTPAFHFEILKNYVQVFNSTVKVMISNFKKTEKAIDVFQPVSMLALDNMLQCMMSYKSDCQMLGEIHPYVKAIYEIAQSLVKRYNFETLSKLDFKFGITKNGKKFRDAVNVAHQQTNKVIDQRRVALESEKNSHIKYKKLKNFLGILILAKDTNGKGFSETEIRDEVDTFLFEGHDTTAAGMAWILYDLATNPEHQEKCRGEVKEILGVRQDVEWEDLSKFNHLTLCIKESMRIHPPVPSCISRGLEEPMKFDKDFGNDQLNVTSSASNYCSHVFPTNTRLEIPILMMHHNPHIWKEPEKFDPYRFTPENYSKIPHFAYIPFSAGPRNCIGQNFAMMEIKITMAKMLKDFKFYVDETCPKPSITPMVVLRSKTGIHLRFKSLNEDKNIPETPQDNSVE